MQSVTALELAVHQISLSEREPVDSPNMRRAVRIATHKRVVVSGLSEGDLGRSEYLADWIHRVEITPATKKRATFVDLALMTRAGEGADVGEVLPLLARAIHAGTVVIDHTTSSASERVVWMVTTVWSAHEKKQTLTTESLYKKADSRHKRKWLQRQINLGTDADELCANAASYGCVKLLRWLRREGCPWNTDVVCEHAARNGNLRVLKWVAAASLTGGEQRWNPEIVREHAERNGYFKVLEWVLTQMA